MAKNYPGSTPQPLENGPASGEPNFYVAPEASAPVNDDNPNLSRDQLEIGSDALQGFPSSAPPFIPGVYEFDLESGALTRVRDQVSENGMSFLPRSEDGR